MDQEMGEAEQVVPRPGRNRRQKEAGAPPSGAQHPETVTAEGCIQGQSVEPTSHQVEPLGEGRGGHAPPAPRPWKLSPEPAVSSTFCSHHSPLAWTTAPGWACDLEPKEPPEGTVMHSPCMCHLHHHSNKETRVRCSSCGLAPRRMRFSFCVGKELGSFREG